MRLERAIKTLESLLAWQRGEEVTIDPDEETEALQRAIDCLTTAVMKREAEIEKAVGLIHDAVFDSDGNLNESAWRYLKDRIDFPPEAKAEIIRRLGLAEKE